MLGGLISAPLAFISGAFFPVPQIVIIKDIFPVSTGGVRNLNLYDLLPTTYAVQALDGVLLYNYGIREIWVEVVAMMVISLALFFIGSIYFINQR